MSGGIDSSVAAIELRRQGYELKGVTFTQLTLDSPAVAEARKMADDMGFEHHTLDMRREFYDSVICNFIDEYLHGRTPNPCVQCNSNIKWGILQKFADEMGCFYIATGHYAQIESTPEGRYFIRKGADEHKDQSYFLWRLTQENLSRTLFPLGKYTKTEVRQIALDNGYEQLSKKGESQEICFIPDNDYRNFLRANVPDYDKKYKKGDFIDINGKVLGKHQGFPNYTIGQRKGLGIALGEPMYVVRIDAEKNQVVLGRKEDLLTQTCYARDLNMMKFSDFIDGQTVMAKVRYKSRPGLAHIYHVDESELQTLNVGTRHAVSDIRDALHVMTQRAASYDPQGQNTIQPSTLNSQFVRIVFENDIESITPGQSVVFYCGDNYTDVLGGAILL